MTDTSPTIVDRFMSMSMSMSMSMKAKLLTIVSKQGRRK